MENIIKVKVTKVSSKASGNGNFIHTIKTEGKTVKCLGEDKTSGQLTYFVALPNPVAVGTEHQIDMSLFTITERPYEVEDKVTGIKKTLQLKWLHVK
jgi:hypothetical protein